MGCPSVSWAFVYETIFLVSFNEMTLIFSYRSISLKRFSIVTSRNFSILNLTACSSTDRKILLSSSWIWLIVRWTSCCKSRCKGWSWRSNYLNFSRWQFFDGLSSPHGVDRSVEIWISQFPSLFGYVIFGDPISGLLNKTKLLVDLYESLHESTESIRP